MKQLSILLVILAVHSFAAAQDMKGMDMSSKEGKRSTVTYTCPMHPEIHAAKPGNCPKCGMKLVKERPKQVKQVPMQKQHKMPKDTAQKMNKDMGGMPMDKIDTAKGKITDMENMQMNMSAEPTYKKTQKSLLQITTCRI